MKRIFGVILSVIIIASCGQDADSGRFTVAGELQNAPDQKVFLEQLFFNDAKGPEVLDTAYLKNGKFEASAIGAEQGLYRIRLATSNAAFFFINDQPKIQFKSDLQKNTLQNNNFLSPANILFAKFLREVDGRQTNIDKYVAELKTAETTAAGDSTKKAVADKLNAEADNFKAFVLQSMDTLSNPIVAAFAAGLTRGIDSAKLHRSFDNLSKRFPENTSVKDLLAQYNKFMLQAPEASSVATAGGKPGVGNIAPDITMVDTSGKPFSLKSLRGKYVLVDFWASWCAPCRGENPNVVANYAKYRNKNFTILGVSLDENKAAWTKAIAADKLAWKQVSDLKGWSSAAVSSYGFDGIPYNVLLDPEGKIIATELREGDLGNKLAEVLK